MKAFDLYIIETPDDARIAAVSGVFDYTLFDMECENCAMALGPVDNMWIPSGVVMRTDGAAWVVCIDCLAPVLFPGAWADRI